MARLIVFFMLFAALALAIAGAITLVRTLATPAPLPAVREGRMPNTARNLAYVLLLLLLAGLTSGWLGPA